MQAIQPHTLNICLLPGDCDITHHFHKESGLVGGHSVTFCLPVQSADETKLPTTVQKYLHAITCSTCKRKSTDNV